MGQIFISHSSRNNESAIRVRDWLVENGWDDIFLDLDPTRGIAAGERWKAALQKAAHRCEVVLALVSPEWLASPWCKAETDAARLMNKKIIVALIGTPKSAVPLDLADEQWVDLLDNSIGYARLKEGLRRAGLDPASFPFEVGRRPYPGFAAFEEKDAAIFFGREAQIVRGLDKMRGLARAGVDNMLVILGASGAGKSSFLRAGLWPRLKRDDRTWLPLPPLRPERAAISGKFGLAQSLRQILSEVPFAEHLRTQNLPRSRAAIQDLIETHEDGLLKVLAALRETAQLSGSTTLPPTIVIPIDQAEELFNEEGRGEANRFLEILTSMLKADRSVLTLVTIRSDAFTQFQSNPLLAACPKDTFTLDMMLAGSYRSVIEGPARLVAPKPLEIDPQLTDALLEDVSGQDALPLLAFTLAHLYETYCSNGKLNLADYESLGRLKGVIATTVAQAFNAGVSKGTLPRGREAQVALIRKAFIPHLARINEAGQFVKRIAIHAEIPVEAQPLIDQFAEHRLLTKDRRSAGGETQDVIEVVHEALLREWRELNEALEGERAFLSGKMHLEQALKYWQEVPADQKKDALLSGNRLERAKSWLRDRSHYLTPAEIQFVNLSSKSEMRRRLFTRLFVAVIAVLLGLVLVTGYNLQQSRNENIGKCPVSRVYLAPNGRFVKDGNEWKESWWHKMAGWFVKDGNEWKEFQGNNLFSVFKEQRQDKTHVYIVDKNRLGADGRDFIVRIPKCGGLAEWTWSNPIQWTGFQMLQPPK